MDPASLARPPQWPTVSRESAPEPTTMRRVCNGFGVADDLPPTSEVRPTRVTQEDPSRVRDHEAAPADDAHRLEHCGAGDPRRCRSCGERRQLRGTPAGPAEHLDDAGA